MLKLELYSPVIDVCEIYNEDDLYTQTVKVPNYGLPIRNDIRLLYSDMLRLNGRNVDIWSSEPSSTYTLLQKAMYIAIHSHYSQTDRIGVPYIYHCLRVASAQKTEAATIFALLHDIWNFPFQKGEKESPYTYAFIFDLFTEISRYMYFFKQEYSYTWAKEIACGREIYGNETLHSVAVADLTDNLRPGISDNIRKFYLNLIDTLIS